MFSSSTVFFSILIITAVFAILFIGTLIFSVFFLIKNRKTFFAPYTPNPDFAEAFIVFFREDMERMKRSKRMRELRQKIASLEASSIS